MALPRTALTLVHVVAVATALVMMTMTAVRTRRDPAWWDVFLPAAVASAAVLLTVSMGLTLPAVAYPLLASASAGLVWFAAKRADQLDLAALRAAEVPTAAEMSRGRRRRGRAAPDTGGPGSFDGDDMLGGSLAAHGPPSPADSAGGELADGLTGGSGPVYSTVSVPVPGSAPQPEPPTVPVPASAGPGAAGQGGTGANSLFGLIAIYTLVEGGGDDFDRLAEQTVEAVRRHEPDTLLFVVHTVPNAPLQRIFYEVYRDRMAYNDHRLQPEVEDFFAKHRPYVLATNVIELDLRFAKVTALPSPSSVLESAAGLPGTPGLPGTSGLPSASGPPGSSALPPASGLPGSSALPGATRPSAGSGRSPGAVGPYGLSGAPDRDEWAMTRNERRP
jgi:quinol monooxygenase YgiN